MFNDVISQVGAVHRRVSTQPREGAEAKVVLLDQTYDADIEDVWGAVTSPERIPRWFLPVSGELRLGGRYQLEGNAGGEIRECEPPRRFAITWEYGGGTSWVEVRLTEGSPGRTTLELEHAARPDEHWTEFGPGAVGIGWELGLLGLAQHLAGAAQLDPEKVQEWQVSPEAKEFMTRSGEGWRLADIEAGAPEADATAAAGRTIAAYTGAGPTADPAG
jgi:uncharacterized protein YndB with AHSA1/START domain